MTCNLWLLAMIASLYHRFQVITFKERKSQPLSLRWSVDVPRPVSHLYFFTSWPLTAVHDVSMFCFSLSLTSLFIYSPAWHVTWPIRTMMVSRSHHKINNISIPIASLLHAEAESGDGSKRESKIWGRLRRETKSF